MEEISDKEKEFLLKNRSQTFMVYHVRTLAIILKMIEDKKSKKDVMEYIKSEIYSMTHIKHTEFSQLIDTLTLQLALKDKKDDSKNNSSP